MKIKVICSDCNGVLEHIDHDYTKSGYYVLGDNKDIKDEVNKLIYNSNNFIRSWLVNEITYKEVNCILAKRINYTENQVDEILKESIKKYEWNWELINLFQEYRKNGVKIIMTTNNMDIFTEFAIPYNNFNKYFDKIYNSSDIGHLKEDNDFRLFKNIANQYQADINEVLIIDDNKWIIEKANEIGFKTYLYNIDTYKDFENWFIQNGH